LPVSEKQEKARELVTACENMTAKSSFPNFAQGELPIAPFYEFKSAEDAYGTTFLDYVSIFGIFSCLSRLIVMATNIPGLLSVTGNG
jgi:hypothetical protein